MSLEWFMPERTAGLRLSEYSARLRPFGVALTPRDAGLVAYYVDPETGVLLMEIGTLVWWPQTGEMNCVSRTDCGERERVALLASGAYHVRRGRYSKAENWSPRRGRGEHRQGQSGWESTIQVPTDWSTSTGLAIARTRDTSDDRNERELRELITK